MKKVILAILSVLVLTLSFSDFSFARGRGHSYSHSYRSGGRSYRSYSHSTHYGGRSTRAAGVQRDSHGRVARSSKEKNKFMRKSGYPHGRPGYVVDHIVPLKRGGSDTPDNMQWQTKEQAKEKDKWE